MKGALACMMLALGRLKELKIPLAGDVIFTGVIDEEMTSQGTCALINQGLTADAVVVGEPMDGSVAVGHRGLQWFEFRIQGRAVHGGEQEKGINAIRQAARLIQRIERDLVPALARRVHPMVGASTINYGFIKGGFQPSTVAGECVLQIDRRWIPGENYRDVVGELEDLLAGLEREDPDFSCGLSVMEKSIMPGEFIHEGFETDAGHPLVQAALAAGEEVTGVRPALTSFKAWTDAGLLGSYGKIPAIVFGPGKLEAAHTSRESIDINQAVDFAGIYAALCIHFCGKEGG
jgi:acetylornithine deacetylase/succinyl-diaminopimelate desuccinylase